VPELAADGGSDQLTSLGEPGEQRDVATRPDTGSGQETGPGPETGSGHGPGEVTGKSPATHARQGKTPAVRRATANVGTALGPVGRALAPVGRTLAPVARGWRRVWPARTGVPGSARPTGVDAAGLALAQLTVLPAVLIVAWLVPGLPLLLGGSFLPVPMLLISVPLAAALTVNGLRAMPAVWPRLGGGDRPARAWTTWFGLLSTVAVVAALTAWQLREASQSVIVVRDAGTYLQAGYWIAQHGTLPIPDALKAFGGPHPGLSFTSIGFLAHGTSIYPAVTSGMPMLLAAGFWAHGLSGAGAVGPILGGLAALSFAGLVARLAGPQWAPAGALILGLSLPEQYISRSTLSETALQVVLFGGLCLLADSLIMRSATNLRGTGPATGSPGASGQGMIGQGMAGPAAARGPARATDASALSGAGPAADGTSVHDTVVLGPAGTSPESRAERLAELLRRLLTPADWVAWLTPQRALAGLAGLALGFGVLVSLDGLLYLLPVIPFCAILFIGRRPQATPFLSGFILGAVYGGVGTFLLDRPFADTVGPTVAIAGVAAVWLMALAVLIGQLTRLASVRRVVPRLLGRIPLRWLPELGALIAAAVLIGFAVRPYVQTVHGRQSAAVSDFIASLQRLQGLPVNPTRLYSEQTLYWVIWYIGLPTVLLGGFGIVLLVRRCLRALLTWRDPDRSWRIWGLPLAILCAGSAVVLWRPDIVPDQPWASRRLVVVALPTMIICALWAASWLAVRARTRGARPVTAVVVGLFCVTAMLVPTISTTFGFGLSHAGKSGGLQPVAQGMAMQRTGVGQIEAVTELCAQIPRKASVVIVDSVTAGQFAQLIRGMCGVPVGSMAGQPVAAVDRVLSGISAAGRKPILLASTVRRAAQFGGTPVRIMDLATTGDPHELIQLPTAPTSVRYVIWMTAPAASSFGA
jgi:hypothetical protein